MRTEISTRTRFFSHHSMGSMSREQSVIVWNVSVCVPQCLTEKNSIFRTSLIFGVCCESANANARWADAPPNIDSLKTKVLTFRIHDDIWIRERCGQLSRTERKAAHTITFVDACAFVVHDSFT